MQVCLVILVAFLPELPICSHLDWLLSRLLHDYPPPVPLDYHAREFPVLLCRIPADCQVFAFLGSLQGALEVSF